MSYSSMRPNDASFLSNVIALHRAALTTASVSAPDSHELEIVKAVFANAIPNITRKNLIALVVSYPSGGKSAHIVKVGLHLSSCAHGRHSKRRDRSRMSRLNVRTVGLRHAPQRGS